MSRRDEVRQAQSRALPVVPPLYQSVTYYLDETSYRDIQGTGGLHEPWYGRFSNPTVDAAARAIAESEGAEAGLMTASGMAAIATTLLTLCEAGTRVVASRQVYGDTHDLLSRDLPRMGIRVDWVDGADADGWSAALAAAPTCVAYAETVSNPKLTMCDIPTVADLAHRHGAKLVIDNTFASPWMLKPLSYGADIVVNSATKFLNGHSDVIAGAVAADVATIEDIQRRVITIGTSLDPHAAFLVWRGMQTLDVRMGRQSISAAALADALAEHPAVNRVYYPGRSDYPQAEVARKLLAEDRAGAMVAFTVSGGDQAASTVLRALQVANEATSLGGVETLVSAPFNSSHPSLTEDERTAAGIDHGLIRVSVGLEPVDELIEDFCHALDGQNISQPG